LILESNKIDSTGLDAGRGKRILNRGWRSVALAVGLAALTVVPAAGQAVEVICEPEARQANLDFTLEDMNGNQVTLSDYLGQVVLLDFWATWCGPCKFEIPGFIDLVNEYGPQGFRALGFAVDEPVSVLRPYAEEMGMNYPVLVGTGREDVQDAYGPLVGLPTTFIIDREGRICQAHAGFTEHSVFEEAVRSLL
jgi:peroxiredoxin